MCAVNLRRDEPGSTSLPTATVLLADNDPISRHVLKRALSVPRVRMAATVHDDGPVEHWPLHGVDTVVLASDVAEQQLRLIHRLAARRIRVLVVAVGWTREKLNAALAAGAAGCLVKDAHGSGLASAVLSLAAGHLVLSPELWRLHGPPTIPLRAGHTALAESGSGGRRSIERLVLTLTKREREVLTLISGGLSTKEVADSMKVSPATIKSHVSHIITKFGVRNRVEAILLVRDATGIDAFLVDAIPARSIR